MNSLPLVLNNNASTHAGQVPARFRGLLRLPAIGPAHNCGLHSPSKDAIARRPLLHYQHRNLRESDSCLEHQN